MVGLWFTTTNRRKLILWMFVLFAMLFPLAIGASYAFAEHQVFYSGFWRNMLPILLAASVVYIVASVIISRRIMLNIWRWKENSKNDWRP